MTHGTTSPTLDYIRKLYAHEDEILRAQRSYLEANNRAIQVGAEEGKLLSLLVQLHQPKRIVEIGTLVGYSTLWMAHALPKGGHIYSMEKEGQNAEKAREFLHKAGVLDRVTILEGDAMHSLPMIEEYGPFDMVFIDADKPGYPKYLNWTESHLRKGGLVVADNTLLFGMAHLDELPPAEAQNPDQHTVRKNSWEAMREFNQRLADAARYDSVMIATHDGLSVAIRKE